MVDLHVKGRIKLPENNIGKHELCWDSERFLKLNKKFSP